jgi:hydroxymethylpyrimidine/phosphomethylpyrimidine kinase
VIDPVLVNHRGEAMFGPDVAAAYRELLFPLADLITPNVAEARLLGMTADYKATPVARPPSAARSIEIGARRVLVKGRKRGDVIVDVYWDGQQLHELSQPFIETINLHGSGDTLSAAICAFLSRGHDWPDAIQRARAFTREAIRRSAAWRLGEGHGPLGY